MGSSRSDRHRAVSPRRAVHHGALLAALAAGTALSAYALHSALVGRIPAGDGHGLRVAAFVVATLCGFAATAARLASWSRGTWTSLSLGPFRLGFCLTVLTAVAYLVFFQPFQPYTLLTAFGIGAGVFALLLLAGDRIVPRRAARAVRVLDLSLFYLCFALVVAELGLRVMARLRPSPIFARATGDSVMHRLEPFQLHWGYRCDERGYPDRLRETRDGESLVVSIGDSFSIGIVPQCFHFTTVAEQAAPAVQIYNMGIRAAGPAEYLFMLQSEGLALRPDYVLLCLFLGNDIFQSTLHRNPYAVASSWFDRNRVYCYLIPRRLARLWRERARLQGKVVGSVQGLDDATSPLPQDPEQLKRQFPWFADPMLEKPTYSLEGFLQLERTLLGHVCKPGELLMYEHLFEVLDEIVEACGDVPLVVLLIPDELQIEDQLFEAAFPGGTAAGVKLDPEQPQRLVSGWLQDRGIPHLDLLPIFRAVPKLKDGKYHLYHKQDTHLNVRGNRVAGEALGAFLEKRVKRR